MSNFNNFQVLQQKTNSPNSGKLLLEGLELPDNPIGFSILAKIWNSSCNSISTDHVKVVNVFRDKKVENGYECIFCIKSASSEDLSKENREKIIREQIWQFGNILRIFLSSPDFVKYCDYIANEKPKITTCNLMLDNFLRNTGIKNK